MTSTSSQERCKKRDSTRFHTLPDLVMSVLGARNAQHLLDVANFVSTPHNHTNNNSGCGEFFYFFFAYLLFCLVVIFFNLKCMNPENFTLNIC